VAKANQKIDLHEALTKWSFDHAVICTFTFEPEFFEQYCLEKFRSLDNNGNITVFVDRTIYDQILVSNETSRPKMANLRYLLFPIAVKAIFHPKVFLFANKSRGLLFIGSANFTRSGLTQNAELMSVFHYEAGKQENHKPIFQQVFKFLAELGTSTQSRNVDSNLHSIAHGAEWIVADEEFENTGFKFFHNLQKPIWEQITESVTEPVESVSVLSKYFDLSTSLLDRIQKDLNPQKTHIFTQNGQTNLSPTWLNHPTFIQGNTEILLSNYNDDGYPQHLHAKALAVTTADHVILTYGSANFTSPALLRPSTSGNLETVLSFTLPKKKLNVSRLFDPDKSAVRLTDASILRRVESLEDKVLEDRTNFEIELREAEVKQLDSDDIVELRMDVPLAVQASRIRSRFEFENDAERALDLKHNDADVYFSRINEEIKRRVDRGATIIQVEVAVDDEWLPISNRILLTNLKDIKSDKPLRRERFVREAQQGISQFFSVLRDLLNSGDQQALLTFLNFCDIPLSTAPRPRLKIGSRPEWEGRDEMRTLGARNLVIYRELHLAAMAFFDRHLRKLRRHTEEASLGGIQNFLHIFLAMAGILRSQAERVVLGLEAKGPDVTSAEWADCRQHLDTYLNRFRDLMDLLSREYLVQLTRDYSSDRISEYFLPDLDSISSISSALLSLRERVEAVRINKLARIDPTGRKVIPGYFHSILGPEKWDRYSQEIKHGESTIETTIMMAA
jgi:HKD family nuclease